MVLPGTLRRRVEFADGFHLIAEKVDAIGLMTSRRE